jgi:hypothetical protein
MIVDNCWNETDIVALACNGPYEATAKYRRVQDSFFREIDRRTSNALRHHGAARGGVGIVGHVARGVFEYETR